MVKEKMVKLHSDIEDAAMTKFHLETKVQRLTEAGIDEDSVTPLPEQVRSLIHCRVADHHSTGSPPLTMHCLLIVCRYLISTRHGHGIASGERSQ